jgi:hypothetical protein
MSAQPISDRSPSKIKNIIVALVAIWFPVVLALSLSGWLGRIHCAVLLIGGSVIPGVSFFAFYYSSAQFRSFVLSQSLRKITWLQASRITGVVFFIYYFRGKLPAEFAIPTGISDISVGISAPIAASILLSATRTPGVGFLIWHLLGVLGLMISGTMGVLTSPAPIGILAPETTSQAMADFPLNLVPTFLGPLILVFHLAALCIIFDRYTKSRSLPFCSTKAASTIEL